MWLIHGCGRKERAPLLHTGKSTFHQGVNLGISETESLRRSKAKLPPESTTVFFLFLFSSYHLQNFVRLKGLKTLLTFNHVLPASVNHFSLVEERNWNCIISQYKQFATESSIFWLKCVKHCKGCLLLAEPLVNQWNPWAELCCTTLHPLPIN